MNELKIQHNVGGIEGLCLIEPALFIGNDLETYNKECFFNSGLDLIFVQDNEVHSKKGVLRGCHVNVKNPQGKLIRTVNGMIYDVVIDLRKGSKTYKKWYGVFLSSKNRKQLYIPKGMGHGYLAVSDADVHFKVTSHYVPNDEIGFAWNSLELGIEWPNIGMEYIFNDKDKANLDFSNLVL